MNKIRLSITDVNVILGEWNDDWTQENKDACLTGSHNYVINSDYPDDIANWLDVLTLDPCVKYINGQFIIDSTNPKLTIRLFLLRLYKYSHVNNKTNVTFYYYSTLVDNNCGIDYIIDRLDYKSNWYCTLQ